VFSSIEDGLYTSIIASLVLLLIRVAHPRGVFLGKVSVCGNPSDGNAATREVFVPLSKNGVTNAEIKVTPPSPGIIIYRFEESYLYPNSAIVQSVLVDHVKKNMRRGKDMTNVKAADRPWNDAGGRGGGETEQERNMEKPVLHAIVLDFSTV
jgi:solute carrier family 26 (sodium-independent sulfate anion transporter), member 11